MWSAMRGAGRAHAPRIDPPPTSRTTPTRPVRHRRRRGFRVPMRRQKVGDVQHQHRAGARQKPPFHDLEEQTLPQRRAPRIGGGWLHPVLARCVGGEERVAFGPMSGLPSGSGLSRMATARWATRPGGFDLAGKRLMPALGAVDDHGLAGHAGDAPRDRKASRPPFPQALPAAAPESALCLASRPGSTREAVLSVTPAPRQAPAQQQAPRARPDTMTLPDTSRIWVTYASCARAGSKAATGAPVAKKAVPRAAQRRRARKYSCIEQPQPAKVAPAKALAQNETVGPRPGHRPLSASRNRRAGTSIPQGYCGKNNAAKVFTACPG